MQESMDVAPLTGEYVPSGHTAVGRCKHQSAKIKVSTAAFGKLWNKKTVRKTFPQMLAL